MKLDDKKRTVFRRALGYLKPHRRRLSLALTSMILYGATDGMVPLLLRRVLDLSLKLIDILLALSFY